jgi:Fe-S-cluster containining protein
MKSDEWVTGTVAFSARGIPIQMELKVPVAPVKPQRILPVIQDITEMFVDISTGGMTGAGINVSCKSGCDACCYHPVPISEAELYAIAELVENMPEPRRSEIKQRFSDAVEHFESIGWFEKIKEVGKSTATEDADSAAAHANALALEYIKEHVACPFLENRSCSVYENRPLVCREYMVTSPAENCYKPTAETIKKVSIFVHASKSLRRLGTTGNFKGMGGIPLIRALELAEKIPDRFEEKTGERWMAEFFENLTADEIPPPAAVTNKKSVKKAARKK